MMNQYQSYSNHFHLSNTTVFQTPSTSYNLSDGNCFFSEYPYEQYSTTGESIYQPIQSFDQCNIYPNSSHLTEPSHQDFLISNTESQIIEQSSIDQKPIGNEAPYKWMQINRPPPKRSGKPTDYTNDSMNNSANTGRMNYSNKQLTELEKEFHFSRYLTRARRIEIAASLKMNENQVKIWFQNRRMKDKKKKS